MLPEVVFKSVTKEDVDRIAWWLDDEELSSRWFGRYGTDDPVHPGYDPRHMLEASDSEWRRTFNDPRRHIFAIYNSADEHIGECQALLDGQGVAQLSLIIGRKDLWRFGYGTAATLELLDMVFNTMGLISAWVTVPVDNAPAIGLFEKLGFVMERGRAARHGDIEVAHLTVSSRRYLAKDSRAQVESEPMPVVAISGMRGGRSEDVGREVARLLGCEYYDDEIKDALSERLQCGRGELEAFENSYRSFWMRLLSSIVVPAEITTAYESGYHAYAPNRMPNYEEMLGQPLTKRQYLRKLARVTRRLAAEGDAVLHGSGCHLFMPDQVENLSVFVSERVETRAKTAASPGETTRDALKRIRRDEARDREGFRQLFGREIDDPSTYCLTISLDHMAVDAAAELIVEVLRSRAVEKKGATAAPATEAAGNASTPAS